MNLEEENCCTNDPVNINNKLTPNGAWYLPYYIQHDNGDTKLHFYMMHLPIFDYLARKLIVETWPASLLDISNDYGMTPLHMGAMSNSPERVRQLLVAGANPMRRDNSGYLPLHYASMGGNVNMVTALTKTFDIQEITNMEAKKLRILDLSQNINALTNTGETPVHLATEYGHLGIIKLLLNAGASLDLKRCKDKRRPLYIAIMKGHKHITKFILKYYQKYPHNKLQRQYCCPELMKPLQLMGLDELFVEVMKIPMEQLYLHNSSDSEEYF